MVKKTTSHVGYYISLVGILLLGFVSISLSTDKQVQTIVIVITTLFYVIWGVLHHLINHDLSARIVVEYILIGSLGLAAILFLLKTGLGF